MTSEQIQIPFLKSTKPVEFTVQEYFINESGLKVCVSTGELIRVIYPDPQCSPP
jgi:hypothetical protein